jgi:flavorubredoxin
MRELIKILQGLNEAVFGSIEWQDEMLYRIKNKLKNKESLNGVDRAFIKIQFQHNEQIMDELRTLGYSEGRLNVN